MLSEPPRCYQAFSKERMDQGEEEVCIVSRTDKMMCVSLLRGARAIWINHHHFAPALAQSSQSTAHVGSRHEAAISDKGVRPTQQEVAGAFQVRHGNR